jgi:hypothetical protein
MGDQACALVDVSNPANPQEVGYYDTPGEARDVAGITGVRVTLRDGCPAC